MIKTLKTIGRFAYLAAWCAMGVFVGMYIWGGFCIFLGI